MPTLESLSTGHVAAGDSTELRPLVVVYGIANLSLLAGLCLGLGRWLLDRLFRRSQPRLRPDRQAGLSAALFLVATPVGMGTLAVFAAALGGGGYTAYYYWADFATPGELALVLGSVRLRPVSGTGCTRPGGRNRRCQGNRATTRPARELSTSGR